jgi:hypothetical protein
VLAHRGPHGRPLHSNAADHHDHHPKEQLMADHTVVRAKHFTLTAGGTVDSVTLSNGATTVEVLHRGASGSAPIYFTVSNDNPANPTVAGDNTDVVMPGSSLPIPVTDLSPDGTVRVELIAASAVDVSVKGIPA